MPFIIPSLHERSSKPNGLDVDEQVWLSSHNTINVGVIKPSHPPFEIFSNSSNFEGISADLLDILSFNTGKKIKVITFSSTEEAAHALDVGKIDMLSLGSWLHLPNNQHPSYLKSHMVLKSVPVFFARKERQSIVDIKREKVSIAVPSNFVSIGMVRKSYPLAKIIPFDSTVDAFDSVYFGDTDVLLTDAYAGHYINGERFAELKFIDNADVVTPDYYFTISEDDKPLHKIVNRMIDELNAFGLYLILSRWQGALNAIEANQVLFDEKELQLLNRKGEELRVGINETYIPYSFQGHEMRYVGITIDILNKITENTGIKFKIIPYASHHDVNKALLDGKVDIAATHHEFNGKDEIISTKSYNRDDILVLSGNKFFKKNSELKRIAISKDLSIFTSVFLDNYKNSVLISTKDTRVAFDMLKKNKVDAVISSLYQYKYHINSESDFKEIKIISPVAGVKKVEVSFGVSISQYIVRGIMDKALMQLSPSEIARIAYHWRSNPLPKLSFIERFEKEISVAFVLVMLMLSAYISRYFYLKGEIQRRIEVESKLKESLAFNRTLFDSLPFPLSVRNLSGELLFCNVYYTDFFNVRMDDLVGKTISESLGSRIDFSHMHDHLVSDVINNDRASISDTRAYLDGNELEIYQWIIPFHDMNGNVKGTIGGWIDVTDRKQLENKLMLAKQQAEAASKSKDLFLATMSHEIRTPMNAIIGFLDIFIDEHHHGSIDISGLKIAYEASLGLLDLIGDILDVSRIESDMFELVPAPNNIKCVIDSVVNILMPVANVNETLLIIKSELDSSLTLMMDATRVKQIIFNVLSNAIKFTRSGDVTLSYNYIDDCLVIIVEDNGIGIESYKLIDIFKPFARLHDNMAGYAGTGLGLSITQQLCHKMNGDIKIDSVFGVGTKVSISIPLSSITMPEATEVLENEKVDISLSGLKILIVDDHEANLKLLSMQIKSFGGHADLSQRGADAIEQYLKGDFDVVITDCQMPGMDGFELTQELRFIEKRFQRKKLVVIGMTASALTEDRERGINSGMDECLFKPITRVRLYSGLYQYLLNGRSLEVAQESNYSDALEVVNHPSVGGYIDVLVKSNKKDIALLVKACSNSDWDTAKKLTHRIRGAVDLVGDEAIHSLTFDIEKALSIESIDENILSMMVEKLASLIDSFNKKCMKNFFL
ncbi:transporter substrate-binding domain-containing protein [Aeromonas salmonicida]|uniref:ATP-binding protein n=1 Tax=Aeromonas salmonicida TaxID=645 RepID=UPI00259EC2A3|nr:transporter substrate-binding domain-containing protein [Aeromonas salmonicida]MDM5065653.1 transporter substrate-binding domain-containing protein [Aeromonas salmonicida]